MNSSFLAFWLSQTVSVLGSGMTKFAIGILLYQKTGQVSALALTAGSRTGRRVTTVLMRCSVSTRSNAAGESCPLR